MRRRFFKELTPLNNALTKLREEKPLSPDEEIAQYESMVQASNDKLAKAEAKRLRKQQRNVKL